MGFFCYSQINVDLHTHTGKKKKLILHEIIFIWYGNYEKQFQRKNAAMKVK
jgi:hypothetical protein